MGLEFRTSSSESSWVSTVWTCTSEQVEHPDDAELFVDHLVRHEVIVRDPVVTDVLCNGRPELAQRTVERRFRAATGLTRGAVAQIERATAARSGSTSLSARRRR